MPELIYSKERKARKRHYCDYCRGTIEKGETYEHAVLKHEGSIYDWRCHKECEFIANELNEYIDPWDGITEDEFYDGCRDFCLSFVCHDCTHYDGECCECMKDESFCVDKIYETLKRYELVKIITRGSAGYKFVLRERGNNG